MKKNGGRLLMVLVLSAIFFLTGFILRSESGIYDRLGIWPESGYHGAFPEEHIDLFTGGFCLKFLDIWLPGPNGFDIKLWRCYNSKVLRDRLPGDAWGIQAEPYSYCGMGWSIHMGRVHSFNTDPIIEFPDGRWESCYPSINGSDYITRSFLKYDKANYKLYFLDGTVWTFGEIKTIVYVGYTEQVRVVTRIENSYGHSIDITYQSGSDPALSTITDSMGRTIDFVLTDNRLDYISVKNYLGEEVKYEYNVITYPYGGYYQLQEYDPPEIPASTYEYNDGQYDYYELKAVNTSFAARIEYTYEPHTFYYKTQPLVTRVLKQKRIRFTGWEGSLRTWIYDYPDYYNADTDTVTVDGPEYDTNVTFYAGGSSNPYETGWRVGLIKNKCFDDNSYSEDHEWEYQQISNTNWVVLGISLGPIRAPLQKSITVNRLGDAESKEEFLYERADVKNYGLPTRVNVYGGADGTTLMHYKTFQYYFEINSTYRSLYLFDYVNNETFKSSSGAKLKETKTDYYTSVGKYGAIDQIERWRTGNEYLTWDYTYESSNPNDITITIDLPGSSAGTETYRYRYGVMAEKKRPDYDTYELSRIISSYNSAIISETNQHGGTMTFTYDNLDRITHVDMPTGFDDIDVTWDTWATYSNRVIIRQTVFHYIIRHWDGMGRDLGYDEYWRDYGQLEKNIFFRKELDGEGRVVSESKGSTSYYDTYDYILNAAGNPTSITDPELKVTNIYPSDDQKTVEDAELNQTVFKYEGLPGLHTQLKDPTNKYADYTYDAIGRLTEVKYNNARTQEYSYNGLDQVEWESHPETGLIDYTYNNENMLWKKTWGGITIEYKYTSDNQIHQIITGDETITYDYDDQARLESITSTAGWLRDSITYNTLGSIKNERQNIPGLGLKTISYDYDTRNSLDYVNYPDEKTVDITNISWNMPQELKFDDNILLDRTEYGHSKQLAGFRFYNNDWDFVATYNNNGALSSSSLRKIVSIYYHIYNYNANYQYDDVGNIEDINNTMPSFNAHFVYDDLYRLYTATYNGGKSYNFTYDEYGNMETAKENGVTVFNQTYLSSNRIDSSDFIYDDRGNLRAEPGYQYVWNNQNYLTDIKDGVGALLSTHLYNERGLRIRSSRIPDPVIILQSPNGGESYYVGANVDITWSSSGIVGNVKIEYSLDNGTSWIEITSSTANEGHYAWTAPGTPSSQCLVRVSEIDGYPSDTSNAVFTLAALPVITIITPNGGEQLEMGTTYGIQWESSVLLSDMKVEYSLNNGSTWVTLVESTDQYSYDWTVPNTPSDNCLVQVTDNVTGVFDVSDAVFPIYEPAYITITSPNGGEFWVTGTNHDITWTTTGPGQVINVKIEYSLNSGTSWTTIVTSTPNDGSFPWTVPGTTSDNCLVRITDTDNYPTDTSDAVFSIVLPPGITVTSPNGGETWETNSLHDITWTSQGMVGNVKIEYSANNGASWIMIVSDTANDGVYNWTVPDTPSTTCLARVSETDGDPADTNNTVFSIVSPASITIISPNGGEFWETGSSHDITWISTGTVVNVKIEFTTSNGSSWSTIVVSTANVGIYNWTIPDNPELVSDNCRVRITDIDTYPTDTSDNMFSIVLHPVIFVTSPNGGEAWEVGDYHLITWDSQGMVDNVNIDYSVNNGASWTTIISNTANDGSYNWWVPDDASGACLVRVREPDNDPADTSDGVFSIVLPAHIKVLAPNGGETWAAGSVRQITWTGPGIYNDVKIDYSINNGSTWMAIVDSTPDDGSYSWTVPDTPSQNCLVHIDDTFSDTDPPDTSDTVFTITSDTQICGETWINSNYSGSSDFNGVIYGNALYAAVGNTGVIMTSANGISWTLQNSNTSNDLHGAAFGNNIFVVVGKGGKILTSPAGTTWTAQTANTTYDLMGITFGGNQFIAVGANSTILTSPDGINWTNYSPGIGNTLYAAAYGNSTYVTVGSGGVILTSGDGSSWTSRVSSTVNTLYGITYGNNQFAAVGGSGTILTSSTGISWTARTSAVTTALRGAAFGSSSSIFVLVGDYGEILTGANGIAWTSQNSGTANHLNAVTPGSAKFAAVGVDTIIYTTCNPLTPAVTLTSPNGGEAWSVGVVHDITWTSFGSVGNVKIDYSVNNGSNWIEIIASTANDGVYAWTIPNNPSTNCLVRVSETDCSPVDTSDAVFSIITDPEPTLTLISPNGGEIFNSGDNHTITWTSTGTVGNVRLEYSVDSGVGWTIITSSTANDGSFDWTVPGIAFTSNHCLVRISEADEDRKPTDTSDAEFTIISPEIDSLTLVSPNGREVLTTGSDHDITWTSTGTVGNIKIEYSIDSGASWAIIEDSSENDGSFDWTVPDTVSEHCLVRISENDEDGTPVDVSDAEFSIISSGSASLLLISPNGGERLPVGSIHVITWTGNGEISEIGLEYSTNNGTDWIDIAASASNSGSYDWTVPGDISDICLVRISEVGGALFDTSDGVFSIIEQPAITVISPNGGEIWEAGSIYPVTWSSSGDIDVVHIEYSIDNGMNWMSITQSTLNDGNYNWLVPDNASETCLVRVKGSTDVIIPDTSDAVFTIVSPVNPILTVNYPNGGETLFIGSIYEITWSSYGTVGEVKIDYSVDNGDNWTGIAASTENNGNYDWLVPDTASETCLVRVSETDDDPVDISDGVFTIAAPSSDYITVTSPNGGEVLSAGGSFDITWDSSGAFSYVNIEYSIDNGVSWAVIVTSTDNDGSYTWGVVGTPSDLCLVCISNSDQDNEPSDVSDAVFSIASTGPAITVTSPNGGEGLVIGTTHDITWIGTVDITNVDIEYSIDNGGNWVNIVSSTGNDGIYTWTVPDKESDQCLVRISDSDADSGVSDVSDGVFSIVTDVPPACGSSWIVSNYTGNDTFNAVASDYWWDEFVAVGNNGVIMTSPDGINWSYQTSNTSENLYGIVYNKNGIYFVVVGDNGTVLYRYYYSNDWTEISPGINNTLYCVAVDRDNMADVDIVVAGANGTIFTTGHPSNPYWTDRSVNISQTFYGAHNLYGDYILVGAGGVLFTSDGGRYWIERASGTSQTLRGVAIGYSVSVAVGDNGVILTSEDDINWTSRTSAINTSLTSVVYCSFFNGKRLYVAVGKKGKILTSPDGIVWTSRSSGVRNDLYGVTYSSTSNRFVAVGDGVILYSDCGSSSGSTSVVNNEKHLQEGVRQAQSAKCNANFLSDIALLSPRSYPRPYAPGPRPLLNLTSPNGNETINAGEKFLITWKSSSEVEKVKLEYSPDNGTTYLPIAVNVPNNGHYEWLVPHHISSHCLVRVSEVKEKKMPPHGLVYEMDFRLNRAEFSGSGETFTIFLGDALDETIKNNLPGISFGYEANGKVYIHLDDTVKEIGSSIASTDNASRGKRCIKKYATENTEDTEKSSLTSLTPLTSLTYPHGFNEKWHNIKIFMDNVYDRISVILDGVLVFESIPRSPMAYFSPAISFSVGPGSPHDVEIDDVSVSALYAQEENIKGNPSSYPGPYALGPRPLFNDDFGRLKEKNSIENSGWRTKGKQIPKSEQGESELKTLSIKADENEQVTVVKTFNVPIDFPFDISDNNFEIRYNDSMFSESAAYDVLPGHGGSGISGGNFYSSSSTTLSNSIPGISRTAEMFNTYYIYTFDGKLLAEYDHNGNCVRDYVYLGNRLLAEYKPQTSEYFYYMTDQINSTRMILNDNGDVVFSEAYGPYGDIQKTWVNTYNPKLKFSGKEREGYSDLDYFGARYFDHKSYRFNSVDPVITQDEALSNPQLWNLYAYCSNNPITHLDPDGRKDIKFDIQVGMWQSDPSYWDAKKAVLKDQFRERALFTYSLSLGVIFPPWVFASSPKGNAKTPGKFSKIFKGKPFPEKLNRAGKMQPYNPLTGQYLTYSVNPGAVKSPFMYFSMGISEGFISGLSGAQMSPAISKARSLGQLIGNFVGTIFGAISK
jgi:RHS repeat-associated protein